MDKIELPTNVRQIGSIETSGLRIYVEDYVFTFVQQYTQANSATERLGILVGRFVETKPGPILFISGAIEGKYTAEGTNGVEFSKKTNEYVSDMLDKYFPGLKIVGWLQSQPGYGTYLSSKNYNYHKENFVDEHQVLYVTDPIQRQDVFYYYNEEKELCESRGYFVYYDKNKPMHEYMIDNRVGSSASVAAERLISIGEPQIFNQKEESLQKKETDEDINSLPVSKRRIRELREATEGNHTSERGRSSPTRTVRTSSPSVGSRRLVSMLAGLSAVMFVVVSIMGAGLIRSDERINVLEESLDALNIAYRNLSLSRDATVPAFAGEAINPPEIQGEIGLVITEEGGRLLAEENARAAAAPASPAAESQNHAAQATAPPSDTSSTATTPAEPVAPIAAAPPAAIPATYIVQSGDNLLAISQRIYGNSDMVQRIMDANNIEDADRIYFGQVLVLPQP